MANYTTINKSSDYFNTKLYTGNSGNGDNPVAVGFQPDLTWFKSRTQGYNHYLIDAIRGDEKYINPDNHNAEASWGANDVTWTSTGFTLNTTGGSGINEGAQGSDNMCSWNWKANGAGSANTDGTISSTVSANTTSGFSIVKFTGTGANATVGHGLGAVPKMYILKRYDASNNWRVYHESVGNGKYMTLETNQAEQTSSGFTNNTSPTSSLISLGNLGSANPSGGSVICYAFAEKTGYSKFGSYVGSNGLNFIYTGFKPKWCMFKRADGSDNWKILDSARSTFNIMNETLSADTSGSEASESDVYVDFLSNGIRLDGTNGAINANGGNYIFMAFGQSLVGSNNVPCTAR